MKTEHYVTKRGVTYDIMLVQGSRCMRLYAPDPADLRAAAQALEDAAPAV